MCHFLLKISEIFSTEEIIPSAGQGVIALQCRENDDETIFILNKINENDTHLKTFLKMIKLNDLEACAEASFQRILDKMESTST